MLPSRTSSPVGTWSLRALTPCLETYIACPQLLITQSPRKLNRLEYFQCRNLNLVPDTASMGSVREGIIHLRLHSKGGKSIRKRQQTPSDITCHCFKIKVQFLVLLVLLLKWELEAWREYWHSIGIVEVHGKWRHGSHVCTRSIVAIVSSIIVSMSVFSPSWESGRLWASSSALICCDASTHGCW